MGKMAIKLQIYYQKIFFLKGEGVPRQKEHSRKKKKKL